VGSGLAGTSHLFDLASSSEMAPVAVCATSVASASRAADCFGARAAYDNLDQMLSSERLDALVVAVPPSAADAVLPAVAASGLPVVIEKPGAVAADVIQRVRQVHQGFVRLSTVAYNRRYQRHVRTLRDRLQRGLLGSITEVRCTWLGPFSQRYSHGSTYRSGARFGEGVLLDTVSHIVDTLSLLGFRPLRLMRASLRPGCSGADVGVDAMLHAYGGTPTVHLAVGEGPDTWQIAIAGTRGHAVVDADGLNLSTGDTTESVLAADIRRPVDDLVSLCRGEPVLGATVGEAAETLDVLRDIYRAGTSRPWIRPRAKALGRLNGSC
jgi:predicted dehydrogenase